MTRHTQIQGLKARIKQTGGKRTHTVGRVRQPMNQQHSTKLFLRRAQLRPVALGPAFTIDGMGVLIIAMPTWQIGRVVLYCLVKLPEDPLLMGHVLWQFDIGKVIEFRHHYCSHVFPVPELQVRH